MPRPRPRRRVGRVLVTLAFAQFFQSHAILPGPPDPSLHLVRCRERDWWAFQYNVLDGACPKHTVSASRTPRSGTVVDGYCERCRTAMQILYVQGTHSVWEVYCPGCRLLLAGGSGA